MKIKILYSLVILLITIIIGLLFYKWGDRNDEASYKKGIETGLDLIINQAKNINCDTIDIKRDSEEIRLINVKCLQEKKKKE